jgi:O-antigen ligase/Tfp pilus assembly protein PilF
MNTSERVIQIIRWLTYALVVLVPLVFYQQTMYPFVLPKIVLFQGLIEILFALWLGFAICDPRYRPRWNAVTASFFALLGVLTITSALGADFAVSMWSTPARAFGLFAFWHLFALYLALSSLKEKVPWEKIWWVTLATSALVSLGSILSVHTSAFKTFFLSQQGRPGGPIGNPAFLAGYLLLNIFVGVLIFMKERRRAGRWSAGVLIALNTLALFYTETRGDIIALGAGVLVFAFFMGLERLQEKKSSMLRSFLKNGWAWFFVIVCLGGALFWSTRSVPLWKQIPGLSRLSNSGALADDLSFRLYAWKAGLAAFKERPILGWGWENFNLAFQSHYNPKFLTSGFGETYWDKPHNIYIEYAVAGGAPGLIMFLALLAASAYMIWKKREIIPAPPLLALLAAYMVRSFVIFDTIGVSLMLGLFLAYVAGEGGMVSPPMGSEKQKKKIRENATALSYLPYTLAVSMTVPIYLFGIRTWHAFLSDYKGLNTYQQGNSSESLYWYNDAASVSNSYQDYVRLDFSNQLENADQDGRPYPDMANLVKQAAEEDKTNISHHPSNYFTYAIAAEHRNQFHLLDPNYLKEAESFEAAALALSPNRQQVYYLVAKTELWQGKPEEAYKTFEYVISLNPEAGDPHFYLGLLAYQQGDAKKGKAEIQKAFELGRDAINGDEATTLATLMGDTGHDYPSAILYYQKALSLETNQAKKNSITFKLAIAYYLAGQRDTSVKIFRELMQSVDLTQSPVYGTILPILRDLGINPPADLPVKQ